MDGMERFMAIVLGITIIAFSALFVVGCVVGIYFLFNLLA